MADNSIKFTIGALFQGEGFVKARQAVNQLNVDVSKSAGIVNGLAGSFGMCDMGMSKAAKAVTGLISGFMTLNPAMLAISGVTAAISFVIGKCNEQMEIQHKRLEALRQKYVEVRKDFAGDFIKAVNGELADVNAKLTAITKSANAFTAAMNSLDATQRSGGILDLEIEKMNAAFNETGENAKKVSDAFYDIQIAEKKLENATVAAQQANEAATAAVRDAESRVTQNNEAQKKYAKAIEETKSLMEANYQDQKEYGRLEKELNRLTAEKTKLEKDENGLRDTLRIAIVKETEIKEKGIQSVKQANMQVDKATIASLQLAEQIEKAEKAAADKAEAEREAARLEQERILEETKRKEIVQNANDLQKLANDSAKDLKKAQDEYAEALRKYNENFLKNTVNEHTDGTHDKNRSGTIPVKVLNQIQGKVADHAVDQAIRNGLITTVKDADKLARQAAREARDMANKNSGQRAQEAKKYERLMATPKKDWSKSDADFVKKFEMIKAAADAQKKDLDQKKQRLEEARKRDTENHDNLKKAVQLMQQLGLK